MKLKKKKRGASTGGKVNTAGRQAHLNVAEILIGWWVGGTKVNGMQKTKIR